MIRLLVWLLLIYIGYRTIKAMVGPRENRPGVNNERSEAEVTHRDPVCGVYVSEGDAVVGRLDGHRHYFCSMECLAKFREQLEQKPS